MSASASLSRAVVGVLVLALLASSGCSWFRKGNKLYAEAPENRPLEVPPELERSTADAPGTATGPVTASGQGSGPARASTGASSVGFSVPGTREAAYERVGTALAAVPGVTIASRAQLLGAFDVNYEGSNFLVRVSTVEAGAYVSAVDPRGLPASGEAPRKLIAALQAALGSR